MKKDMSFPHKKTSCYIQLGMGKMDGQPHKFLFHGLRYMALSSLATYSKVATIRIPIQNVIIRISI